MRALCVVVGLCVAGIGATARAQQALEASSLRAHHPPEAVLILRPEPGLEELAREVAIVLELRTGERVEVGEAPPPGLLEAVPTGHVAMAQQRGAVLLVLGAPGGRSFDATVEVARLGDASAARAVALAAEDLRDTAVELARVTEDAAPEPNAEPAQPPVPARAAPGGLPPADDGGAGALGSSRDFLGDIDPLFYVRVYGGASTATEAIASGVGTALGLCVHRHCLFVAGELPVLSERGDELDVRYHYPTFVAGFYSRPFQFGRLTPGASLGFLTRLGHFEADMGGSRGGGLETDLGARGSLELAYELVDGLDVMSEAGLDYTIDRDHVRQNDQWIARGDRFSPWAQAAVRFRP